MVSGASSKFWAVQVRREDLLLHSGRIGAKGQRKTKTFASPALARRERDKLVVQKVAKGYVEVGPARNAVDRSKKAQLRPKNAQNRTPRDSPHPSFSKWRKHVHQRRGGAHVEALSPPDPRAALDRMKRAWKRTVSEHRELAAQRSRGSDDVFEMMGLIRHHDATSPQLEGTTQALVDDIASAHARMSAPYEEPGSAGKEAVFAAAMRGVAPESLIDYWVGAKGLPFAVEAALRRQGLHELRSRTYLGKEESRFRCRFRLYVSEDKDVGETGWWSRTAMLRHLRHRLARATDAEYEQAKAVAEGIRLEAYHRVPACYLFPRQGEWREAALPRTDWVALQLLLLSACSADDALQCTSLLDSTHWKLDREVLATVIDGMPLADAVQTILASVGPEQPNDESEKELGAALAMLPHADALAWLSKSRGNSLRASFRRAARRFPDIAEVVEAAAEAEVAAKAAMAPPVPPKRARRAAFSFGVPVEGKGFAFNGRLRATTQAEAKRRLLELGAQVSASAGVRTHFLVEGANAGCRVEDARLAGIVVVTEKQLLGALASGVLGLSRKQKRAMRAAPGKRARKKLDLKRITELCAVDVVKERGAWSSLCEALDGFDDDTVSVAVDLALERFEARLAKCDVLHDLSFTLRQGSGSLPPFVAPLPWTRNLLRGRDSPKLRLVGVLNLQAQTISAAACTALASCSNLANVRVLDLAGAPVRRALFQELSQTRHMSRVRLLRLPGNISPAAARSFGACTWMTSLRRLALGHLSARPGIGAALARGGACEPVQRLSLRVDDSDLRDFFGSGTYSSLRHVQTRCESSAALRAVLGDRPLASLWLSTYMKTSEVVRALGESAAITTVRSLELSLRDEKGIVTMLAGRTRRLEEVCLRFSSGRARGPALVELVRSPHMKHLKCLQVDGDKLGDEFAYALADAQHLGNLRALILPGTRFTRRGLAAILEAPHLRRLHTLFLGHEVSEALEDELVSNKKANKKLRERGVDRLLDEPFIHFLVQQ